MHFPKDKVNITWGQFEEILQSFPERLKEIERLEIINSCYQERHLVEKIDEVLNA